MSISMDDSLNNPKPTSTRQVQIVKQSQLFKIMGHSRWTDVRKGHFIESAIFNVGGYDWAIQYYPKGLTVGEDDQTSIFIRLKSKAEYINARTSFRFLSQNGRPLSERQTTKVYARKDNKMKYGYWGFLKFAKRSEFESALKDDCLVIKCNVTVIKSLRAKIEPAFPLHLPPPEYSQVSTPISKLLEDECGADVTVSDH